MVLPGTQMLGYTSARRESAVPAHITYMISGTNSSGDIVSIQWKAVAIPPIEAATYLLREKYPSAKDVNIWIPAAHKYPDRNALPLKVADPAQVPIRKLQQRRAG